MIVSYRIDYQNFTEAIFSAIWLFFDFADDIQSSRSTDCRHSLHVYDKFVVWLVKP
jgi:hypothetical protein